MMKEQEPDIPNLLFCSDFPPCDGGGGAILASRLLSTYPSDKMTVLTSARALKLNPSSGRLQAEHLVFPRTNRVGRWGWGRIQELTDWLLFPLLLLKIINVLRRKRIQAMVTIAHGDFILAVAVASAITAIPFIVLVHDDWIDNMTRGPSYVKWFRPSRIFSKIVRAASQVYVVSPYMQARLKAECGIDSELQMPAIAHPGLDLDGGQGDLVDSGKPLRILYAGTGFGIDCLSLLARLIKEKELTAYGIGACELHLYMPLTPEQICEYGWLDQNIIIHGWVSQTELQAAFADADILFLPFSFEDSQRLITETSFPTKTSDYLVTGKPILICAPAYSSAARYAAAQGFAEVVSELSSSALAQGVFKIYGVSGYREQLKKQAQKTFNENHNLEKQRKDFLNRVRQVVRSKKSHHPEDDLSYKRVES